MNGNGTSIVEARRIAPVEVQSTAIVPFADLERMAQAIAKSQLFGVKTADQAIALMLVAQAEGKHPAIIARDYDIIQNRPAKKSEAMLRDFISCGGSVKWHGLTDTLADAEFSHPQGGTVRITWDNARAQAAGLVGKDMWKKYPRQMLRARTISEGVRTVCPAATSGMYVPEEVRDFGGDDPQSRPAFDPSQAQGGINPDVDPPAPSDLDRMINELHSLYAKGDPEWDRKHRDDVVAQLKKRAATKRVKFDEAFVQQIIDITKDKIDAMEAQRMQDADAADANNTEPEPQYT